jgi:hypothetical protein
MRAKHHHKDDAVTNNAFEHLKEDEDKEYL